MNVWSKQSNNYPMCPTCSNIAKLIDNEEFGEPYNPNPEVYQEFPFEEHKKLKYIILACASTFFDRIEDKTGNRLTNIKRKDYYTDKLKSMDE